VKALLTFLLLALFSTGSAAHGDDFSSEPFPLRVLVGLDRASNFASSQGIQASAAYPHSSSINPAATDLAQDDDQSGSTLSLSTTQAWTSSGALIGAFMGAMHHGLTDAGTLSFAYTRTDTYDGETRNTFEDILRSNEFFFTYGRGSGEGVAYGGELRIVGAHLQEETEDLGFPARFETDFLGFDMTLGRQARIGTRWSVGQMVRLGWHWGDTSLRNMAPVPSPVSPPQVLPVNTELAHIKDTFHTRQVRLGVGYDATAWLDLYTDAQYLHFDSNKLGSVDVGRLFVGADVRLGRSTGGRLGIALDTESELTSSASLSHRIGSGAVELAYQHNALPEVERELGTVQQLSLTFTFPL